MKINETLAIWSGLIEKPLATFADFECQIFWAKGECRWAVVFYTGYDCVGEVKGTPSDLANAHAYIKSHPLKSVFTKKVLDEVRARVLEHKKQQKKIEKEAKEYKAKLKKLGQYTLGDFTVEQINSMSREELRVVINNSI